MLHTGEPYIALVKLTPTLAPSPLGIWIYRFYERLRKLNFLVFMFTNSFCCDFVF
jgi:hypothetical protein